MIDSRAIIDPTARLAEDVEVGPWSIIGPDVEIDSGTVIASHVIVKESTRIGKNNKIYQFSSIGEDTADMKYQGEKTWLELGDNNIIREGVTLHRGTVQDRGKTTIGNNNLLMAYVHVGHDSVIGDHTVLVNNVALAGHVKVDDWAILGGYTLIHQYTRVGAHCFCGMGTAVGKDVPAYMMITGNPAAVKGINVEGLKRRGYSSETLQVLKRAYKIIYRSGLTLEETYPQLEELVAECPPMSVLIDSLKSSTRGIVR